MLEGDHFQKAPPEGRLDGIIITAEYKWRPQAHLPDKGHRLGETGAARDFPQTADHVPRGAVLVFDKRKLRTSALTLPAVSCSKFFFNQYITFVMFIFSINCNSSISFSLCNIWSFLIQYFDVLNLFPRDFINALQRPLNPAYCR